MATKMQQRIFPSEENIKADLHKLETLLKGNLYNETQLISVKKRYDICLDKLTYKVVSHDHLQDNNTASTIIKNNNLESFMGDTTRPIK